MFNTILIANRGEIACRVIRTARRLGIRTVAVYSEADADALHVALADEAHLIGPAPARESYLAVERILAAARASGAQAIHPGYGFLSENAEFAEACGAAGVVFVGPPPEAIRAMGSKATAKALMERSGVPLVPGYHGADQDPAVLRAAAGRIGYPVLIKASAGGGGKGMRIVERAEDLDEAVALAKGEARSAFGDDHVLIERYLARPRHIEIQVFADTHGNVVSLFERDCSIQRRHQKVVEEAPAPSMTPERRRTMGEAACAAARATGYVGAGTVEFIAEGKAFHFMEMNTRLQVEHPVTEAITGQDLVEWQLRVAAGEKLPLRQDQLGIEGHAIEVRVYAEDPARDFAPSIGTLRHLRAPEEEAGVRIDTGVREGDAISVHYDPMIAKLIVHGPDRAAAVRRLSRALAAYEVAGVQTNLGLLRAIAAHPAFRAAELDTGFIARHADDLLQPPPAAPRAVLAAAVKRLLLDEQAAAAARGPGDPHSPWNLATAWRLNGDGYQDFVLRDGEAASHTLRAHLRSSGSFRLDLPDGPAEVSGGLDAEGRLALRIDGVTAALRVLREGDALTVFRDGVPHALTFVDPRAPAAAEQTAGGRVTAPMPGRVLEVLVAPGDAVARGAALLVLEAMKVQMRITAPADGVVAALRCAVGDLVDDGAELITFAEPPSAA
jgi:3-methylcrotonyl-CoA carboxylase alpha subunit